MLINGAQFPAQKLTQAEKIKEFGSVQKWGEYNINSILKLAGDIGFSSNPDMVRKQGLYDLAAGIINKGDFDHVSKPWGLADYEFPATFTHYDLISPKLNLLKGEEIKRPFNYRVVAINDDGYNEADEHKKKMLFDYVKQELAQELEAEGIDINKPENQQLLSPEYIEHYMKYSYKGLRETTAQNAMNFLVQYCDLIRKFNKGFNHLLITGEELYWTGIINGEPAIRVVNPNYFACDRSPGMEFIDEASWAREIRYLSASEVHDEFHEELSDEQVDLIEKIKGSFAQLLGTDGTMRAPVVYSGSDVLGENNYFQQNSMTFVKVCHVEWVSLRKIGILTYKDKNGQDQETIVPENYKIDKIKGESIEWMWINEVWEGDKIGNDIFVNIKPKPNQYRSLDNPSRHRLGYTGLIYNNLNSRPYSLVEIMSPHNFLYDIIMYRLELEIAKAQGKKMIFDISQIPKSMGMDTEKWMYYFNILGVAFLNPHEEGKGKMGQGKTSNFNQFQAIDMSLARVVDQYVMILNKLEDMIGEISGVTRQREGQISTSELVGNVERATLQSSHITEPLFYAHNEVKRRVITNLLEDSKLAWIEGKKIHYVMDDMSRQFFEVDGDSYPNCEYGIFVTNQAKEQEILNTIKQLAESAVQSGNVQLLDVVKIMQKENVAAAESILEDALERSQQQAQQMEQVKQQAVQQQIAAEAADKDKDRALKKYEIDIRADTEIHKAEIMSFVNQKDQDVNDDGIPDQLEIEKLAQKERESVRNLQMTDKIEASKNELENKKIKHEKEMQDKDLKVKREEIAAKKTIARSRPKPKK